ncbi:partial molybdopterin molybdotransferase,K07219; putative molybdopterin biosynthesis protein, partial [Anaerolineae bacterium]
ATHYPGYRLTSANVGSIGGLVALRRQEAHLTGVHLLDLQTGAYNIPYLGKYLPNEAVTLVNFAHREQGFIVAAGNPHHMYGVADLTRVRFVNRQRGAGTRFLLDYELQRQGISPESIVGYDHEEVTHLAVAAAVASGVADCGMGVRSAASAMGLDFIPFGWEQYDLVIPDIYQSHLGIQNLLTALRDPRFHQLLGAQPGYDTRQTGQVVFP